MFSAATASALPSSRTGGAPFVTSNTDSDASSLRQAITDADNDRQG